LAIPVTFQLAKEYLQTMGANRVDFTPATEDMLRKLYPFHKMGFMFHQSGGCCDGSSPMCYEAGEFRVGPSDVLLGVLQVDGIEQPVNFYMSLEQFEYWKHTHLTIDLVPGRGSGFSLEAPEGFRFLTRSRLFTEAEYQDLNPVFKGSGELLAV
jgi:uncharacterized protein (DUF779 family)